MFIIELTNQEIELFIKANSNYTFLNTYKVNRIRKIDLICDKDHMFTTHWSSFRKGHRCRQCSYNDKKMDIKIIHDLFISKNLTPIFTIDDYGNSNTRLPFICNIHNDKTQYVDYHSLKKKGRFGCVLCANESVSKKLKGSNSYRWKGGLTTLHEYMRDSLADWKKESIKECNFRCVISKCRFDVVHHVYGFDLIIKEAIHNLNIEIKEITADYTKEELQKLREECIRLHDKYPKGVCLTNENHAKFHKIYGYGNNTLEIVQEFFISMTNNKLNEVEYEDK